MSNSYYGPCYGHCGEEEAEQRYSLGIYAGKWCNACWGTAPYHKEGPEGFSPDDAGESYEEER